MTSPLFPRGTNVQALEDSSRTDRATTSRSRRHRTRRSDSLGWYTRRLYSSEAVTTLEQGRGATLLLGSDSIRRPGWFGRQCKSPLSRAYRGNTEDEASSDRKFRFSGRVCACGLRKFKGLGCACVRGAAGCGRRVPAATECTGWLGVDHPCRNEFRVTRVL